MGCQASNSDHPAEVFQPLDDELQQELNVLHTNKKGQQVDRFEQNHQPEDGFEGMFEAVEETQEEFMATKPWIGALVAPNQKPSFNPQPPNKKLKLSFINGFKVEDSRQNMFWGKNTDQITYCAAAVGVVMNVKTLKQRYMGGSQIKSLKGHNDDIISLGLSPDRKLVVTGSLGALPMIIVWDSDSMQVLAKTNLGRNTRAVSTIRFSRDGKYFFCSDKHNDSNVYCFTVTGQLVGTNKCGSDPVFDAQSGTNNTFAVATNRGMWFFNFDGSVLNKKRGIFGSATAAAMITVAFSPQDNCFFSGTAKGQVYRWEGNTCSKCFPLHEGAVMGLTWAEGKLISSGGKDKTVKISTADGQTLSSYQIPTYAKSLDLLHGDLLVATKCGRILTINEKTSAQKEIMHGHSQGQTWGLAISQDGLIYTTGDDNSILCFNPKSQKVEAEGIINNVAGKKYKIGGASTLSLLPPNQQSRAIAVSKSGHVIIGCNDGTISVRTTKDLNKQIFSDHIAKQWIEVIKYSPDNKKVAVGSHDNNIYILNVNNDSYTKSGVLKAHQSFITNLDWSRDGRFIHSNCGAYQYLFFNVQSKSQIQSGASQLRDQKWATYTVKIGWWVQGIFPKCMSGDHVNGVDRNKGQDIIATGDDWGLVNLYRNPALKSAKPISYKAHSSHVVRVQFDNDDKNIYSVGGYDKTLMMWKYE